MYIKSPTEIDYPSNLASEKPSPPWTLAFLQWTRIQNNPSQPPLFLNHITFLSFVGLVYGFCYSLLVPNCNSLMFLNKSIFAGERTGYFLFKVNRGHTEELDFIPGTMRGHQKPLCRVTVWLTYVLRAQYDVGRRVGMGKGQSGSGATIWEGSVVEKEGNGWPVW